MQSIAEDAPVQYTQGMYIKGLQFGVKVERRSEDDPHVHLQVLKKDDMNWGDVGDPFSNFWLADLISVLQQTKNLLEQSTLFEKDPQGYGVQYKKDAG
jgi:hypothetical protein